MARDWNAISDEAFRAEAAALFATCPPHLCHLRRRMRMHEVRNWYETLSAAGWLAPGWPVEHGGMGLNPSKRLIYIEEWENAGVPRVPEQGVLNLGPILIARGTPKQRSEYLPKILSGEHVWCQGYSEPNAGSDLASLRTEARLEDDTFVITGQKIWTSMAMDATHMFALVRTNKTVAKQAGISFLMLRMHQPGVDVRPIVNLAGREELCEVFLDGARTHRSNLVGGIDQGWDVAKALLGFERLYSGSPQHCIVQLAQLRELAVATGASADAVFCERLNALSLDVYDLASAYQRFSQVLSEGGTFGTEVSLLKIWATETCQRITELAIEVAGDKGGLAGDVGYGAAQLDILTPFFDARPLTIYGGSNQIQRNIIAKQVLGLPN